MGHHLSVMRQQHLPYKTAFTAKQMPDLTGRVAIVTGGNSGIGRATMKSLLNRNAKAYMASRSRSRAEKAIRELREETGKEASFLELDLSSLRSVQQAAKTFLSKEQELHILFNNAGLMPTSMDKLTTEGYDMQYGTHVLGHFLFQELLLDALTSGTSSSPDKHTRIITTTSSGAHLSTVNFGTLRDGPERRKVRLDNLYFQSKFLNGVVAYESARRYAKRKVLSFSVDPGSVRTEFFRNHPPAIRRIVEKFCVSPEQGAVSLLWAGTMPEAIQHNGQYIVPWAHVGRCRKEMYDRALGEQVWETLSEHSEDYRSL
ncbi:NAD(P)-binding protein [Cristinia sonorae]|uniref:NAD(P)-binding protein n=1 Tax=Cristinia sonorae TaxID=1940300 RepID=A0A8K0UPY2_9AGAR|nr:NAD(P)-binding protein [Cristinia sonorae]